EGFVVVDDVVDPRYLVVDVERLGQAAGDGGASSQGDVEFSSEEGGVDVAAGVEPAPDDLGVGQGFFQPAVVLDEEVAVGEGRVADARWGGDAVGRVGGLVGGGARGGQQGGGEGEHGGQGAGGAR